MSTDERGGDPVLLGSCLFDLESKLRFEAWVSIHELGLMADHEITFDTGAGGFRLVASLESEGKDEPAREGESDG